MSEIPSHEIEDKKSILDYYKHLATLSTGSIVLLITFLEKLFLQPRWKAMIVVTLIGFTISVVGSVAAHTLAIFTFPGRKANFGEWLPVISGFSLVMAWGGFLIGVASLSIFALRNLI